MGIYPLVETNGNGILIFIAAPFMGRIDANIYCGFSQIAAIRSQDLNGIPDIYHRPNLL